MAINSYDDILASIVSGKFQERYFAKTLPIAPAAGVCVSLWEADSMPAAGGSGTAFVGRPCIPTTTGAIAFANASGDDENYLINVSAWASASGIGSLMVYDRILDVGSIDMTSTSLQSISMSALPRYADGEGVMMFLEVTSAITGAPVFTISYTDQAGNPGTTATVTCSAYGAGRFAYAAGPFIPLAAGDTGVRSAASITFSVAGAAGAGRLVFAKPLVTLPLLTAGTVVERDLVTQTPRLPMLPDDHCLSAFIIGAGTTTGTVYGSLSAIAG